jgi:hypothetical protein
VAASGTETPSNQGIPVLAIDRQRVDGFDPSEALAYPLRPDRSHPITPDLGYLVLVLWKGRRIKALAAVGDVIERPPLPAETFCLYRNAEEIDQGEANLLLSANGFFPLAVEEPVRPPESAMIAAPTTNGRPPLTAGAEAPGDVPEELPPAPPAPGTEDSTPRPDLVLLDQAAWIVHKSKRTLERCKTNGELPAPAVEGGGGRADLYDWPTLRPWLETKYKMKLPATFPANRVRIR